jgi:hypothetical protein
MMRKASPRLFVENGTRHAIQSWLPTFKADPGEDTIQFHTKDWEVDATELLKRWFSGWEDSAKKSAAGAEPRVQRVLDCGRVFRLDTFGDVKGSSRSRIFERVSGQWQPCTFDSFYVYDIYNSNFRQGDTAKRVVCPQTDTFVTDELHLESLRPKIVRSPGGGVAVVEFELMQSATIYNSAYYPHTTITIIVDGADLRVIHEFRMDTSD